MSSVLRDIKQIYTNLLQRWSQLIAESSPRSLQLTGILGLAALLYSLYHIQAAYWSKNRRRGPPSSQRAQDSSTRPSRAHSAAQASSDPSPSSSVAVKGKAQHVEEPRSLSNLQWVVQSRLSGMREVTISAPGILLEESTPEALEESATVRPEAMEVVKEMARHSNVYIISQVAGRVGEAVCRGAMESAGIVGSQKGQIPPQRFLFCSTLPGKASIVRQLEPQLHIEANPRTVEDLKRFIRLVYISPSGQERKTVSSGNVGSASSLAEIFN